MTDSKAFAKIRIGIASPSQIRAWSYGEVKKPETINYRTFKPERDGLFCERIFGPQKDFECHCGRYKKQKFRGVRCERCGVEVTRRKVRRERMGHIELASPVCHIWYLKGQPSPLALVLDIPPRSIEKVLYFGSYIVTSVDRPRIDANLDKLAQAVDEEIIHIQQRLADDLARLDQEFAEEVQRHTPAAVQAARERLAAQEAEEAVTGTGSLEGDEDLDLDDEDLDEFGPPLRPDQARQQVVPEVWDNATINRKARELEQRRELERKDAEERSEELRHGLELLKTIQKRQLITEDGYRAIERLIMAARNRIGEDFEGIVTAGMGGAAIKQLLDEIELESLHRELQNEVENTTGTRRARAIKRLEIVEAFIASKAHPSWMILECIPVISPELRPMVQLDGGRFATSDLNDLYRRIINRNNRLRKIIEIRAPESIVNHEKRLLQEAVDALIDNGRRNRPVVGSNNRPLKSLSDMLKGKDGRFRKNLLGKRVDYSGRSVIVVGPHLKLHQCGLPKEMALELFKPFVMKALVQRGSTTNIKTAKRMIDRMRPEVWDALEEVIREHPVLLNRAPTLHRLGIQAFEPVLVEGKAIQIHPLVCHAYNADFDGDQMAVHVPLSAYAQAEARALMLSTHNLFSPANGNPIVAPIQDIVLGAYYLTMIPRDAEPQKEPFSSPEEAILAHDEGLVDLHEPIVVRIRRGEETFLAGREPNQRTSVGRLIFNQVLPENLRYRDAYLFKEMKKKDIADVVSEVYRQHGAETTLRFLDDLKDLGFRYATRSGVTMSMTDMDVPAARDEILRETEATVARLNESYKRGRMSRGERKERVLEAWTKASERVAKAIMAGIEQFNPIWIITYSGARGSSKQITQLSGMRGVMSDPFGNLIEDLPIKSNFQEGLNVLEYFVSTHGARKGLADTALRTADAGYLTRRLVDVAQDVIIRYEDCGTTQGIEVGEIYSEGNLLESLSARIAGRVPTEDVVNPLTGEIVTRANEEISDEAAAELDRVRVALDDLVVTDENGVPQVVAQKGDYLTDKEAERLVRLGAVLANARRPRRPEAIQDITTSLRVSIRSVLTCELRLGVCAKCYGRDLATGRPAEVGLVVGIIAAQSIGEPGTQLTMRTFHTGGVAGKELVGVANVRQKRQSALKELHEDIRKGHVSFEEEGGSERERNRSVQAVLKVLEDQVGGLLRVVELFEARKPKGQAIISRLGGRVAAIERKGLRHVLIETRVNLEDPPIKLTGELVGETVLDRDSDVIIEEGQPLTDKVIKRMLANDIKEVLIRKPILVPHRGDLNVEVGDELKPGDRLTDGPLDPHEVLELHGPRGVQEYLIQEIQHVYKSQGVDINDKHIEVIVRQMLRKRRIEDPGDCGFLPSQIVDKFVFQDANQAVIEQGGRPAEASWVLLGITEASLATESFLSAASFQKTTRVLTEAAVRGKTDELIGLKENVIIGRLIPAGTGLPRYRSIEPGTPDGQPIEFFLDTPSRDQARISSREAAEKTLGSLPSDETGEDTDLEGEDERLRQVEEQLAEGRDGAGAEAVSDESAATVVPLPVEDTEAAAADEPHAAIEEAPAVDTSDVEALMEEPLPQAEEVGLDEEALKYFIGGTASDEASEAEDEERVE